MFIRLLLGAFIFLPYVMAEKVYERTTADGVQVFTDKKQPRTKVRQVMSPPGFQSHRLDQINHDLPLKISTQNRQAARLVYKIRVDEPEQKSTHHSGDGNIDVQLSIQPKMKKNITLKVMLDGKSIAVQPKIGTTKVKFVLEHVVRGEHVLLVSLHQGSQRLTSQKVTFYVHRPRVRLP